MAATIGVATSRALRDEGGRDTWRLDFDVRVRVHNRFRTQLCNPAQTQSLLAGVQLGILRPTRVTYVTHEAGTSRIFSGTWSPDERAAELSAFWKGEAHLELSVTIDASLQAQTFRPRLGLLARICHCNSARHQVDLRRATRRSGDRTHDFKNRAQTIGV